MSPSRFTHVSCGRGGHFWGEKSSKASSEADPRWPPRLRTIEWLASGRSGPEPFHVEAVGTYSRSQSDVRGRALDLDGPSTTRKWEPVSMTRQGSLGLRWICNAGELVQGKLILIPCPSRAHEVVTPRGTSTGAVPRSWTSMKSERTALVC